MSKTRIKTDNRKRVKDTLCPTCKNKLDAATGILDQSWVARPGDMSVCFHCGEILTFTADMDLRLADLNDMMEVPEDYKHVLEAAQRSIRSGMMKNL